MVLCRAEVAQASHEWIGVPEIFNVAFNGDRPIKEKPRIAAAEILLARY